MGGGIIYILPYIQYSFYNELQQAFGINNVQMGNLMSLLGIVATFAYLFGGILADKFNVKWLISLSLAVTGIAGLWFSTFPSYPQLLIIMGIYGISTILTYWPAMIKAVKLLGSEDNQGRMFGFREAGFGIFAFVYSQVGIWLIYNASPDINGVRNLIIYYSIIYLVTAVLSFIFIPNSTKTGKTEKTSAEELFNGIKFVIKIPAVWLIGLSVFCAYAISGAGLGKLVPYWTSVMGIDSSKAAALSSLRLYLFPFLAAPLGGLLVDKFKSSTKYLNIAYILLIISLIIFVIIPGTTNMAVLAVILGLMASFIIYTMRGTYFVPMAEANIPNKYLGTAAGIISFIGFLPDAFMFTLFGKMMGDAPGVVEYKTIFGICIGLGIAGFMFNKIVQNMLVKRSEKVHAENHSL
jgi:MFS family permease